MNRITALALLTTTFFACKKSANDQPPPPPAPMHVTNLADTTIRFGRSAAFDLDGNGSRDVAFGTQLVGDPLAKQDKKQWLVTTSFEASLPVNAAEEIPVLNTADSIPPSSFRNSNWYNASSILLAQQVLSETAPPFWTGTWQSATHRFIPVQLNKAEGPFNGWIEVSFSTTLPGLTLHRAAVSTVPGKTVRAGL